MSRAAYEPTEASLHKLGAPALRRTVLDALRESGPWSPGDVFNYGRRRGGSAYVYEALRGLVAGGRVVHEPKTAEAGETWRLP